MKRYPFAAVLFHVAFAHLCPVPAYATDDKTHQAYSRTQVSLMAKPATALVEVEGKSFGSSFCIHNSGIFVTNSHVVKSFATGDKLWLVLNPSLPTERKLMARIVRASDDDDIALLAAAPSPSSAAAGTFIPLELGDDSKLAELTELIAFGYPFGTALAEKGKYPAISANITNVSSLRRDNTKLEFIQVDSNLNPGNSGGPVLGSDGKVVGMVVAGIPGAGINLLIPSSRIRNFLGAASIDLQTPSISSGNLNEPQEFTANYMRLDNSSKPVELELVIHSKSEPDKSYPMTRSATGYKVKVPYISKTSVPPLLVKVKMSDAEISALAKDSGFSVGNRVLRLLDLRDMKVGASAEVQLRTGEIFSGALSPGAVIPCKLGKNYVPVAMDAITRVEVEPLPMADEVSCTVIARSGGAEISRCTQSLSPDFGGNRRLAILASGKFAPPVRSKSSVSYLRMKSAKGDYIGQGKSYDIPLGEATATMLVRNTSSAIGSHTRQSGRGIQRADESGKIIAAGISLHCKNVSVEFASQNNRPFEVAEYQDATRYPFNHSSGTPGLSVSMESRGSNQLKGAFRVWEFEYDMKSRRVLKLAVDFVMSNEGRQEPLCGVLRFNSSFE